MDLHANFQWKYVMKTRFGSRLKAKIDYFIDVITAQQHEWFMKIQAHLFCQMIYAKKWTESAQLKTIPSYEYTKAQSNAFCC